MDEFSHIFVFSVENMRNNLLKDLRQQLGTGRYVCELVTSPYYSCTMDVFHRMFLGKNKVLQLALGRNESDEYKDGLHFVSKVTAELFTN